jgi:hypothetical protein
MEQPSATMRGIRTLKLVTHSVRAIDLPPLRRPPVKPDDPKTQALAQWGICIFIYSLIAHMQKVLAGLVQLGEAGNVAASAPVCRHVFEWAALSCYLIANLKDQFKQRDWEGSWELLTKVALGNRWIREHGSKYAGDPPVDPIELPGPVHITKAVLEYEKYQSGNSREAEARDSYGLLCEVSHPNAACLLRYHQYEESGAITNFIDPDQDPQRESFLPFVNCCLIDLLTFGCELLELADESDVRPRALLALKELASLAPARLTGCVPP